MNESSIQPELVSLRGKLVDAISQDEKQRDLIDTRITKNRALLHAINGSLGIMAKEATGYGAIAEMVRSAIKLIATPKFTSEDIERQVKLAYPTAPIDKDSLRTAIWNLVRKKEINQIRKGTNQIPAQYEKINGILRTKRETEDDRQHTLKMHENVKVA